MPKKSVKTKSTKSSTVAKKPVTVTDQIHALHACIKSDEAKLPALYNKALMQLEKQLDQQAKKVTKAKDKAAAQAAKLKTAKEKLKAKKTAATKSAVDKLKLQSPLMKAELVALNAEIAEIKNSYAGMKLLHKKFVAQVKALNTFEKAWEKSLTNKTKKKPAKKKAVKKSAVKKAEASKV